MSQIDLVNVVDASWRPDVGNMSPDELRAYIIQRDHCSSLVKVTSDLSMLYACTLYPCLDSVRGDMLIDLSQPTLRGTTTQR